MSEKESAAMDGLAATEPEPNDVLETATSGAVAEGLTSSALEGAVSTPVADSGEAAANTHAAAGAEAAPAFDHGTDAADTHAGKQQQDEGDNPPAPADSASSAATQAAPGAAEAAAEKDVQQQPEHAAEAHADHAPDSIANSTPGSAEEGGAAAAVVAPVSLATDGQQPAAAEQQPRQSSHSEASRPTSSSMAASSPEPQADTYAGTEIAAGVPTAAPVSTKQHAQEEEAAPAVHAPSSQPHKETAAERLTTPTAMRMLKTLQETQGDKAEWHIASGVVYKSKKLAPDEMAAMVDRLCVAKHKDDDMPARLHAVKLVYDDNGKEGYEPVKEVTKQENISYMAELYSRCQETRAKTHQQLAEKYLQPLVKPKPKSPAKADKTPAAAKA